MFKIHFVISTYRQGDMILFDFPDSELKLTQRTSDNSISDQINPGLLDDQAVSKIFSFRSKIGKATCDISLKNYRYINYPIWFDLKKYVKKQENEPERASIAKVKMFNIVLVFDRQAEILKKHLNSIKINLTNFSTAIEFEEYRCNYLSRQVNDVISQGSLNKPDILTNVKKLFESTYSVKQEGKGRLYKLRVNNWYHVPLISAVNLCEEPLSRNDTFIVTNYAKLKDLLSYFFDVWPIWKDILDKLSPFKSLYEICTDCNFSFEVASKLARQVSTWKAGKIFSKVNSFSVFRVNPSLVLKENEDINNILDFLQNFTGNRSIDSISKQKGGFTKDDFIDTLSKSIVEEYLIPCNTYVLVRGAPLRPKQKEQSLLQKLEGMLKNIDEKEEATPVPEGIIGKLCMEIEQESKIASEVEIMRNISYFLGDQFSFSEICFMSGYKCATVDRILKKFSHFFYFVNVS